jgi:2-dehydro-3-deoxyglucarate aldolase
MSLAEYIPAANRSMVCIIQIETLAAVNNAEEIAKVPGIDCLFVGLTDLSVDLGCPGDYTNVAVEAALDRVLRAAQANGVPVGLPITDPSLAASYHQRGATLFATTDRSFVTSGATHWMRNITPRQ